jgi:cytochrome c553
MRWLGAGLALIGLAGVASAVRYGPVAWDAWRFGQDIAAVHERVAQPHARGAMAALTCDHCHGENGNSINTDYPSLAGLPAAYLQAQMADFASGRRQAPQMQPLAMALSAEDVRAIGEYYAAQDVGWPAVAPGDSAPAFAAERLQTCKACHGQDLRGGTGVAPAPRLAGQSASYLLRQLHAFRSGARQDATGAMVGVARTLEPAELEGLARAASALRPAPP